jgi:hypothetical protein
MYIWDAFPGDKIRIPPSDEIFVVVDGRRIKTGWGTVLTLDHGSEITLVAAGEQRRAHEAEEALRAARKWYYCVGDYEELHRTNRRYHHTARPCDACVPEADYLLVRDIMRRDPFGTEEDWWAQLPPGFNERHLDDIFRVAKPDPDRIAVLYWDAWRKLRRFAAGCLALVVTTTMLSVVISLHLPEWIAYVVTLACLSVVIGVAAFLRLDNKIEIIRQYWPQRARIRAQLAAIDERVRAKVQAAESARK